MAEDIETPRKKRKLEVGVAPAIENHVTNGDPSVRTSVATPTRTQSHLQFNQSVIQRLRQITKDCQKNISPAAKPNGSKIPLGAGSTNEASPQKNSTPAATSSSDFIISSAGSSPAHSPQPTDFEVLSTPPRPAKPKESDAQQAAATETKQGSNDDLKKACSRLVERFEESSSSSSSALNRTLTNGVCPDSRTLDQDSTSVEVLEEGDQTLPTDSTAKTVPEVNGDVKAPAVSNSKEQNSPALADVAPRVNAEESRGFNYNSEDFKQMLKKMIEERMTQIERSIGSESEERLALLEKENKALKEHAKKVEDTVKNMLTAEKEKARQRVTRAVQTLDPHWLTGNLRVKTVATAPPPSNVTITRPTCTGLTLTTTPTPRLTSTVAPLPGHTVPSHNAPVSYHPGLHRPSAEPMRPRIPATPNIAPRPPPPGVTYVPNYDPGPAGRAVLDQLGGIRASAPGPSFSTSAHPRFNGVTVRAASLATQPPRPVVRMQAPIVSPGGPRSIAPPSSRPLPTVTVHPQTPTPSSATSVRIQQEPPSYGYSVQNVYNSGQSGPRFTVAPQMRPQGPQHSQGSPGPRTPVYPHSPVQASPPQRIMQQSLHAEQQNAQIPRSSVQIRTGTPVQMQSSPHAINQHRPPQPQQPGMVHYQAVAGPPRQATPAQPQPNYGAVPSLRPPTATAGIPPGAVQQPPPILRASPSAHGKEPPPKPSVSIAVVTSGIVLSWNMVLEDMHSPIMNYQLYALQDGGTVENAHQWKKIGVVKALPLPMACTLTQFLPGNKYHFAVRGTDEAGRLGPFSDPCTITLK